MVHALKETWRVLVPNGSFVDLRPLAGKFPLEVVSHDQVKPAGFVDDTAEIPTDIACSESLEKVTEQEWFHREREESFDYLWYWDTIDEMKDYMEENWDPTPILPKMVFSKARQLLTSSGNGARVRLRMRLLISRYRKRQRPVHAL
ncbi:MAG: hypothetical protein V3U24_06090 [Candidatus Neomarinimicrobiota bacterium]